MLCRKRRDEDLKSNTHTAASGHTHAPAADIERRTEPHCVERVAKYNPNRQQFSSTLLLCMSDKPSSNVLGIPGSDRRIA